MTPVLDGLLFDRAWICASAGAAVAAVSVASLAIVVGRALRGRPAPLRHGLLLAALVVLGIVPAVAVASRLAGWGVVRVSPVTVDLPLSPRPFLVKAAEPRPVPVPASAAGDEAMRPERVAEPAATPMRVPTFREAASGLLWAWLGGFVFFMGLVIRDLLRLRQLRQSLVPCPSEAAVLLLREAARSVGLVKPPRLLESAAVPVPVVIGPAKPVVVLPLGMATSLEPEKLSAVLLHEAAHVVHGDLWVGLLQHAVAAVFWWCPPVHRLNRRLADVREEICDDYVVSAQGDGFQLAEVLVEMAAGLREKRQRLAIGTLGVIDEKPTLEGRVERLVDLAGKAVPMTRMNRMAVAAAGAFGAVALAIVVATTIHAADELTAAERKASAAVGADSPSGSDQRTKKPEMLMQLSQDGTVVRKLCDVPTHPTIGSPALSPAGDLIACDGNRPGTSYQGTELLMINADGTNVECLGNGAMPSWSADGTRLAFSCFAPRGVWVLNLATKKRELIDNEGWGIQWSPDGKYWAYSRRGALVVKNVATGEVHEQVADFRDDQVVWGQNMAWSPDGRSLCGVVHLRNNQSAVVVEMLELPRAEAPLAAANPQDVDQFDGGGMRLFYVGQDINRDVAWHPSGHRIVFTTFSAPTGRFQMFEFDPTKDSMPSLVAGQTATNNFDQCWSADGKTLLYVAEPNVDGDAEQ